jgi:hypothetical protein
VQKLSTKRGENAVIATPSNISTNLPVATFPNITEESRKILTNKTMNAFTYIYNHDFGEYEWFFKADDDTYVIMDNLRHHLKGYNPEKLWEVESKRSHGSAEGQDIFFAKLLSPLHD